MLMTDLAAIDLAKIHVAYMSYLRPDQFKFWEHRFFPKFEGSVRRKKK